MSERIIDAAVESRREVGAGYSPLLNKMRHKTDLELEQETAADAAEDASRRVVRCTCYPVGIRSMSVEEREEMKRDYLAAGKHRIGCALWVDYAPLFDPPSYTLLQRRRDEAVEAEQVNG